MKKAFIPLPLLAASAITLDAALLAQYTFDGDSTGTKTVGTVLNDGGNVAGNDGTLSILSTTPSPAGGNYAEFKPTNDGIDGINAPHLFQPGATIGSLAVAGNQDYTMGGWVRFDSQVNDNMVFGGGAGAVLHLGSRGDQYHSGHWGDDVQSTPGTTTLGVWNHVVWTNTAAGVQAIYVNGLAIPLSGDGSGGFGEYTNNPGNLLLVGTSQNQGSFNGALDDIRVYNNVLTPAEISAWAVPEPGSVALLGLAGFALACRRRRA